MKFLIRKLVSNRTYTLKSSIEEPGNTLYWMSREQRTDFNHALNEAFHHSVERRTKLYVVFSLTFDFLSAETRHYDFMLAGLVLVSKKLQNLNIHFEILEGIIPETIAKFIEQNDITTVFCDFDPLKIKRNWKYELSDLINCSLYEIDSHNIVPCRLASTKQEFSARTIRPKINKLLPEYLTEFPQFRSHPFNTEVSNENVNERFYKIYDRSILNQGFIPGEDEAVRLMRKFINEKLNNYPELRNHPELNYQSNLSPYLHFGQLSSQRVALEVMSSDAIHNAKSVFLDEIIIRKELSDNYCFYNDNYDNFDGVPEWGKKTLLEHLSDKRKTIYNLEQFEYSDTDDIYWNSAQKEMRLTGKMHGYMRMYWAKRLLEWTHHPNDAFDMAVYLNDKYQFDGRDPNGYAGIAWSIGGLHDRPWAEREIFGKVRYMNANGLKRKFDIEKYVQNIDDLSE